MSYNLRGISKERLISRDDLRPYRPLETTYDAEKLPEPTYDPPWTPRDDLTTRGPPRDDLQPLRLWDDLRPDRTTYDPSCRSPRGPPRDDLRPRGPPRDDLRQMTSRDDLRPLRLWRRRPTTPKNPPETTYDRQL
nr:myelin-associated oligodendrocyte basic protein-like [Penaeus vannamei]